jgi:hypothetical protein
MGDVHEDNDIAAELVCGQTGSLAQFALVESNLGR